MIHLALSIASYGTLQTDTAICMAAMVRHTTHQMSINARQGPYTHWNRESLVDDAREDGATHMLFLDTDLIFPYDAAMRLLDHGKDVVGANYYMKVMEPRISAIKIADENGDYMAFVGEMPKRPFKCAAIPTGLMLIDMRVFDKIEPPYFPCTQPTGEDVAFCRKVTDAGMEVWCDPTIPVGHIGNHVY